MDGDVAELSEVTGVLVDGFVEVRDRAGMVIV